MKMNSILNTSQEDSTQERRHFETALSSWAAHVRLWLVTVLGVTLDLWTKQWAFDAIGLHGKRVVITDILTLQPSLNSGALWGMGRGLSTLFVVASLFALVFVMYIFSKSHRGQYSFHIALGMVLAGAMGNLYDRVFGGGEVRDFIKIDLTVVDREIWPWIFNIADVLLVCGVCILLLNIWLDRHLKRESQCEKPASQA